MNYPTRFMARSLLMAILGLIMLLMVIPSQAAVLTFDKDLAWSSNRGMNSKQFAQKFKRLSANGYIMIDMDAYPVGSSLRYSMIWRKNTDNRKWAEHRNLSSTQYNDYWKRYKSMGYRPTDYESYSHNGKQLYAGIWVENKEGVSWVSRRNMTGDEYNKYFTAQRKAGRRLIDVEIYETSSGLRYAGIWIQNKTNTSWIQIRNMSRSSYQKMLNDNGAKGFMVVDVETYRVGGKDRYAAIWEKRPGFHSIVRTNRSMAEFDKLWTEYRDKGYRLIDFERNGSKYGGVWLENSNPAKRRLITEALKNSINLKVTLMRIKTINASDNDKKADYKFEQKVDYRTKGRRSKNPFKRITKLGRESTPHIFYSPGQIHVREGHVKHINNSLIYKILPIELIDKNAKFEIVTDLEEMGRNRDTIFATSYPPNIIADSSRDIVKVNMYAVLDYLKNPNSRKYIKRHFADDLNPSVDVGIGISGKVGSAHKYGGFGNGMWFKKGANNSLLAHLELSNKWKNPDYVRLYYRFELVR